MFYDERIENERGRISRNCIINSIIGAFVYGSLNLINMLVTIEKPSPVFFLHLGIEAAIILGGALVLILGAIKAKGACDERGIAERYNFYNKASVRLLAAIAAVWALLMPLTALFPLPSINFYALPYDYGLHLLFFPIAIYCVYSFKKNEIYFNYSILESEHYYKGMLLNIGKFGIFLLKLFGISFSVLCFMTVIMHTKAFPYFFIRAISCILSYVILFSACAALYALLSILEKKSYDNQTRLISGSTSISLSACAILNVIAFFVTLLAARFIDSLINSDLPLGFSVGEIVAAANYAISYIQTLAYLSLIMCITYFYCEYRREHTNRLLSASLSLLILKKSVFGFLKPCFSIIQVIVSDIAARSPQKYGDTYIEHKLSQAFLDITFLAQICEIVLLALIICALIKDGTVSKANIIAIAAIFISAALLIFLSTQLPVSDLSVIISAFGAVLYIYLAILVFLIGRKNIHHNG